MTPLIKPWFASFDWDLVIEINRGLCKQKNALHKETSDGYAIARDLWTKYQSKEMPLTDALEICLKCHRMAPFCFYNGNTFAAIARDFIAELNLPPDQAFILRSIAGHIVAGTATDIERKQMDALLAAIGEN